MTASAWPFAPVAMRVHPFTSITFDPEQNSLVLEVRMELLDQVGDVTKGVGDFRFELYADKLKASLRGVDERLNVWDGPVSTLEQNRQHYDSITRTYSFKLRLDPAPPADQKLRLVAQFTDPSGKRILAEAPLSYTPGKPGEPTPAKKPRGD